MMSQRPARILVVEDEARIAEVVQSYLERDGHVVAWRRPARRRSPTSPARRFDLLVLDLGLPGVSGEEVCRQVRAESDVPIIMLTARDAEEDLVRAWSRRRRLPHQAVQPARAHGPGARPAAPGPQRRRAAGRRAGARRRAPGAGQRPPARHAGRRDCGASRSPSSGCSARGALPGPRLHSLGARRAPPGHGVRAVRAHHRRPHQEPAAQAGRRRARAAAHPDGLRSRLHVRRGRAT